MDRIEETIHNLFLELYIIIKKKKRLNKLFIRYAQIFGPAAFLGGAKTD